MPHASSRDQEREVLGRAREGAGAAGVLLQRGKGRVALAARPEEEVLI